MNRFLRHLQALFLLSAALSTACCLSPEDGRSGGGSATSGIGSGIPAVMPASTDPCTATLDFGNLPVGQAADEVITIVNTGTGPLHLALAGASLDPAFAATLSDQVVPPGGGLPITVTFQPIRTGLVASTLKIPTDGLNSTCPPADSSASGDAISLNLTGTGVQLSLIADPNVIDFGYVPIDTMGKKTLTLANTSTVAISGISATIGGGDESVFIVRDVPTALQPGATATVEIDYAPVLREIRSLANIIFVGTGVAETTVNLFGASVNPVAYRLSPNPVDCDDTPVGDTSVCCTTIYDQSNVLFSVNGVSQFEAGSVFALATTDDSTPPIPIVFPITLSDDASAKVCFTFTPSGAEEFSGRVTLDTTDPSGTNPVVQLTGRGSN